MATTFVLGEGKGEEPGSFPILYCDDHNLFPSLLPFIEARLPLDGVPIRNPFSPHAAVCCNTLRVKFIHRDCISGPAVPPKPAVSGSSAFAPAAAAVKLAGTSPMTASIGSSVGASVGHASTPAGATAAASTAASSAGGTHPGLGGAQPGRQGRYSTAPAGATTAGATKPFVYLQILQLENIEDYKTHHRRWTEEKYYKAQQTSLLQVVVEMTRILRAWVDNLTEQHEEWLVLYVTPFSESETQSRTFRKILDKLRSDLNPPGSRSRERFLRVPTDPTGQYSHAPVFHDLWNAFMLRLKEALAAAVEGRYVQLEDEVQRQTQALEPRFCAVFTAKEDLAQLHALCNRPDEALAVLDSLDLLRNSGGGRGLYDFQVAGSDVLPWHNFFHTFGFATTDSQVPVLLNQRRLARLQAALREDTISYVDFRQYLFARQAELLLRLNRLEELGARAVQLVSSVYKEVLSRNITVGGHTWALLAALNFAGYLVAQSAVPAEQSETSRAVSEATPRSMAIDDGSLWRSSRRHDFAASPSSSPPSGSPYLSLSSHPLLPLKYPTLASAARTLHRFTPLQFSFSPTRRGHASQRGRVPPVSLQADAPAAPAPAAPDPAADSLETGSVEYSGASKESSCGNAGGVLTPAAAACAAPAPSARYAGVLYGYAAQQLQRLIRWRERCHWYTPLVEIPLTETDPAGQQRGSNTGESALSGAAVDPGEVEAAAADKATTAGKTFAVASGGAGAGQQDGNQEGPTDRRGVDDEPLFCPRDMERLEGVLFTVSRKSLLEELQTAAAMEDMLARVFVLAGQQFMNGGYYRHAALLQFRLAAANFRRGCLEECRSSLSRLLPLFLKEPWTELWLECQQLLCEADRSTGDAEAELRSAYVLSNVKAQRYSKKFHSRAALVQREWKMDGGASGASAATPPLQSGSGAAATEAPLVSVGTADAGPAAGGDYGIADPSDATGTERSSVNPREFLQRFIMLARSHQAERLPKRPGDAGGEAAAIGQRLSPPVMNAAGNAAATEDMSAAGRPKENAAADSHATSATQAADQASGVLSDAVKATGAGDEAESLPHRTPTCAVLSDLDCCETLCTEERSLHLSSSPNLYCWAALAAWWPSEDGLGERIPRECVQPALPLASAATLASPAEPLVASNSVTNGPPHSYRGESVEGTPYTLRSITPTGATTTTSFFSNPGCASSSEPSAAVVGQLASYLSCRRQILSSLPPDALTGGFSFQTSLSHAGLPRMEAASVLRGSQSRVEVGEHMPHGAGGISKGSAFSVMPRSPASSYYGPSLLGSSRDTGGTGAIVRNLLRATGSVDHDLLEHAVLRQLADLLPLYQLPCHPELGPHAYLFAYVATLLRLKPKSVAQVLGQHQSPRMRRPGAPQPDRVRIQKQRQGVAAGDDTEQPELPTVAATEHAVAAGDEQLLSRPRSAVRAASEGTQKRPRGITNTASAAETDVTYAEAVTPASAGLITSGSGLSGGLRDFRWRRSKTLTHVSEAAVPKDSDETAAVDVKGDQGPESYMQPTTRESGQRSSSRNTKGTGRVSLLLSRRRRSTSGAAAPSAAAAVETAGRNGKKGASAGEQEAVPGAAVVTSGSAGGQRNEDAGGNTSRTGALASDGRGATRLPEQFCSCAQQLPATALDTGMHAKTTSFNHGQSPVLPLLQTRPRDVVVSHARTAGGDATTSPRQQFYDHAELPAAESLTGPNAGGGPRSRALSVLEMSSMQNVLPSLSVSLGQHIELQLYVHSRLAGPLPADYIAVRLSQLPTTCLDAHLAGLSTGGTMRTESRLSVIAGQADFAPAAHSESPIDDPSRGNRSHMLASSSIFGEEKEELFEQQYAGGAASMWLVARSQQRCLYRATGCSSTADEEKGRQGEKQLLLSDEAMSDKFMLKPGVNRLSLLWSSRIEGVFVLEQICIGVGAAALVQWAGDLPLPDMMDAVAETMQKVLLTASLLQDRWHRQKRGGTSPSLPCETAPGGPETGTVTTAKLPGDSATGRASVSAARTTGLPAPVADGVTEALRGAAETTTRVDNSVTAGRGGSTDETNQRAGGMCAVTSHAQANCTTTPLGAAEASAGTAAQADGGDAKGNADQWETHCWLPTKQIENPLFQPVDCGNLASASAFEERADPPAWLLQHLALGCSPLAATLLQPVAPLERMLRPLVFEVRSPSTAVQIHVRAASPSDNSLFLDATNFFVVRVDVMPGLLAGPRPCRLRVLQCLLPVVYEDQQEGATDHGVPRELQMQDNFLLGEDGAESSVVGDLDTRCYQGDIAAGGKSGFPHSRMQLQAASMCRGRSGQQERGGSPLLNPTAWSPGLLPRSPGTASAATWRRYFREGGGNSHRTTPQSRLYRQGSTAAVSEADRLGRYNSVLNSVSRTYGMAASAAYGERHGRSHSLIHKEKDTSASPWTPVMHGFDHSGPQPDEQQLFEAAAVHLQFQWHQAVAQSVDGVSVYQRLGGQKEQPLPQRGAAVAGAGNAGGGRNEDAEAASQSKHHVQCSVSEERSASKRPRSKSRRAAAPWHGGEAEVKESLDGGLSGYGSDSNHSETVGGDAPYLSCEPGTCAGGVPQGYQRHTFLRICAEDEDGDILALVPEQCESGSKWKEQQMSFFPRIDSALGPAPPGRLHGGGCWLELPPFQTSCEILVPVIPVWVDAAAGSHAEPYAAAAAAVCAEVAPNVDAHVVAEPGGLSRLASASSLSHRDSHDDLIYGDTEDFRGDSRLAAMRPHSEGRTRVSMARQESSSPLNKERYPSGSGRQELGTAGVQEEMLAPALSRRRFSSCGNNFGNALRLHPYGSRALTLVRVGWGEEGHEGPLSEQCVDEMLLPRSFPFRRRRSAFVVPPSASLPLGAEGVFAAEAATYGGTAGRIIASVVGAQDLPLESPAARAAQRVSVAAMLSHQQQLHEQQRGEEQQEQLRKQQHPEMLQHRFSAARGCFPPPLEYHVHIVTTLQFYTQTGFPAAAAARACQGGNCERIWGLAAAASPTKKPQQKLCRGCWISSYEAPATDIGARCESGVAADETLAAQVNELGVLVPSVYPRRTAVARRNTVLRVFESNSRTCETGKSDPLYTDRLAQAGVPAVNASCEGADESVSLHGGNGSAAAPAPFVDYPYVASGLAAETPRNAACQTPCRRMLTAAATTGGRVRPPDEMEKCSAVWREFTTEAYEEGGPPETMEEEAFDSVEVCAQDTTWLRQQQRRELAAVLHEVGEGRGHTQQQEATTDDTEIPSGATERDRVESDAVPNAAGKRRGMTGEYSGQTGQRARQTAEIPASCAKKGSWRSCCAQQSTVMLASTSRVHRLAVRVALQHSERLLHVSEDALLQQVLLSSCCSPAEPVVVESASIARAPSGRSDDDFPPTEDEESEGEDEERKRTRENGAADPRPAVAGEDTAGSKTCVEKPQRQRSKKETGERPNASSREICRRRKRRLRRPSTKVFLIASPPADLVQQVYFFAMPPQEAGSERKLCEGDNASYKGCCGWTNDGGRAESVRLDSLLFGEKMTALLVHLEHRRRHGRKQHVPAAAARGDRRGTTQREENVIDFGGKGNCGGNSSDSKTTDEAVLRRRIRAAFEPKVDVYILSVYYRFLQRPQGTKQHRPRCAARVAARAGASAVSLGGGDQELYVNNNDEATTQDTETTEPEEEGRTREELLVYRIPLVFPVQQFPCEVRFHAPRVGRVSTPLVVCLVFTNCGDIELDVRHTVSLEFDEESGPAMRTAAKFYPLSPLLSSRSLGSRLQLQYSRMCSAAGSMRLLDDGSDGARFFSGWRDTVTGAGRAAPEEPGKGSISKKDTARSSRLGECHDWLMVGSKSKATSLAAHSTVRVHFELVPLRAGCLPLPTIRVRVRPSSEYHRRLLANCFPWQYPTGVEPAAAVAGGSEAAARAAVSAAAAVAERGGKVGGSPGPSADTFSLSGQNLRHHENDAAHAAAPSTDWWLPVPYGESVTAGREVLVLPKVVSKPDARLLPD